VARFEYAARDDSGSAISGDIVAASRNDAARILRAEGKFVVKLIEAQESTKKKAVIKVGSKRVKEDQVIYFTNQLAVMVDTGVPIADALSATIEDEPISGFRSVIEDVINHVQAGQEFSKSLERHPRVFPKYFCNIIKASEASGLLGTMLQRVSTYMTNQRETKKQIIHAMAYPIAMIVFCILIAAGMIVFLLPRFANIFESRGSQLPAMTQCLMSTSSFLASNWYIIVPSLVSLILGLWYFARTASGFRTISWLKLNSPILGSMYRKAYVTRSMRTMGTMIDSGVSMLETVDITRNIMDNYYYEEVLDRVDEQLQRGNLLSDSLKGTNLFPHTLVQMIASGERAGQMGPVMNRVADFCEQDLKNAMKTATQLIEPMLVIFMGVFIGVIVISLLLPIFSLSKVVARSATQ